LRQTCEISGCIGLCSAGNYRNDHLPCKGLVDFTSSQISPITLWSEIDQNQQLKQFILSSSYYIKGEVKSVLRISFAHNNARALWCKHCPNFECFGFFWI
jgi:hypothetical protein